MTLGFPYRLGSVPIIDPSVIQEGARSHCLSSRTLPATAGRRRGVLTKGLSISESWHGRHHCTPGAQGRLAPALCPRKLCSPAPAFAAALLRGHSDFVTCCASGHGVTCSLAGEQDFGLPRAPFTCVTGRGHFPGAGKGSVYAPPGRLSLTWQPEGRVFPGRSRVLREGGQRAGDRLISDLLHVLPLCAAGTCSVQVGSHLCPQRTQA